MMLVVCAWKIPDQRIKDFFAWNDFVFRKNNICVAVVTDRALTLPDYARNFIYPVQLEIFSITKLSNYGIRKLGDGLICKTDIDIFFDQEFFDVAIDRTKPGYAVVPVYRMCQDFSDRGKPYPRAAGTVSMDFSDWQKLNGYDERMSGYGIDDGDLIRRAKEKKIVIDRDVFLHHLAHDAAADQSDPSKRSDLWNGEKINPRNHNNNMKLMLTRYVNPAWGIVG